MDSPNKNSLIKEIIYQTDRVKVSRHNQKVKKELFIPKNSEDITYLKDFLEHSDSINHKNLIKYCGIEQSDSSISMNCDYIGPKFTHFIDETEPLKFLRNCIDALYYLQDKEIAHNDIKIENILKSANGEFLIIDFDYMTYRNSKNIELTIFIGTKEYLSPEKIKFENKEIDCFNAYKSDVFSLGISFLKLLTGQFPANHNEIGGLIVNLPKNYQIFSDVLESMLCLEEENRPDFIQLKEEFYQKFRVIQSFSAIGCRFCKNEETNLSNIFVIQQKTVLCKKCFCKIITVEHDLECQDCYEFSVENYKCLCRDYCLVCKSERHDDSCAIYSLREMLKVRCLYPGCDSFLLPGLSYFRKCGNGDYTCVVCRGSFKVSHEFCVFLYNS